jgi:FAD/FMN-containing dehydrogenase
MGIATFRKLDGSSIKLEQTLVNAALGGEVLYPGSAGYADACRLWNAMIERRPAAIVRATSEAHVVKAVALARAHGLLLAVKGGGHNIEG